MKSGKSRKQSGSKLNQENCISNFCICLFHLLVPRNVHVNMAEAKKKLKKMTIRESHRTFLRKIIAEARESLKSGESVNINKLKFFKSTLQDKSLELKSLDKGVFINTKFTI